MTGNTSAASLLDGLADEALHLWLARIPVHASRFGFHEYDEAVPDPSAPEDQRVRAHLLDLRERSNAIDPAALEPEERITHTVLLHRLSEQLVELDSRRAEFDVGVSFAGAPSVILHTATKLELTEPPHAEAFLARCERFETFLAAAVERLAEGVANGRIPTAKAAEASIDQLDRYLASSLDDDPLAGLPGPSGWPGLDGWRERLRKVVDTRVRPAMASYRSFLEQSVLPVARPPEKAGLCWLPDGEEVYAAAVRTHTTTTWTPQEIHDIGRRVGAEVAEASSELAVRAFGSDEGLYDRLRNDQDLRFRTPEEIVALAEAALVRAEAVAGDWFGRLPAASCQVVEIPAFEAVTAPRAYYQEPARDGTRPGTYWANTAKPGDTTRYDAEAIAFHEGVPGHHLQVALMIAQENLPLFRRLFIVTAYVEGWGLYAERLADEMGLYADDLQRLGMFSTEAMRACRLVVDTGLHALGWSRDQAIAYIREHSAWPEEDIAKEVDRYIAIPGQALSYLVGSLEIQRLRQEAAAIAGGSFDLRGFHDEVLGHGALPLTALSEVVLGWAGERAERR